MRVDGGGAGVTLEPIDSVGLKEVSSAYSISSNGSVSVDCVASSVGFSDSTGVNGTAGWSGAVDSSSGFVDSDGMTGAVGSIRATGEQTQSKFNPIRIKLDIAYDGTDFAGWAMQHEQRTVAGVVTRALEQILRCAIRLTVAGRTDAGVHATGQVAHCDIPTSAWHDYKDSLVRRLAGVLPLDVRVRHVEQVSTDFDARFSALRRHYVYRVCDASWGGNPLRRSDTLWFPRPSNQPLSISAMNEASALLVGEHDFAAFCRRRDGATTIRALQVFSWRRDGEGIACASVSADAFCHSMVRSLVGAVLAVGAGRRPPAWPRELLTTKTRSSEVSVAAAHGLTLVGVDYPPLAELATRAVRTRQLRGVPAGNPPANSNRDPLTP